MGHPRLALDISVQCSEPVRTGLLPRAENWQEVEPLLAPVVKPGEVSASHGQVDTAVGCRLWVMPLKQKILVNTSQA